MTISRTTRNVHSFPGLPTEGLPGFVCFVGEATHPGKVYPSVDSLGAALKKLVGERHPLPLGRLATQNSDGLYY